MVHCHTHPTQTGPRRRGHIYVAVLSIALIVMITGVSAILIVRNDLRAAAMTQDTVRADLSAQSVMDLATFWVSNDPNWRTTYTSGTWTPAQTINGVTLRFKLVDEIDGNLADDPNEPARLYAKGIVGDAVRIYSVQLSPRPTSNLLTNPGFESGTTGWQAYLCTITASTSDAHTGQKSLEVKSRTSSTACPYQDITSLVQKGATYECEIWAKVDSGSCNIQVAMCVLSTGSGTQYFTGPATLVAGSWTKVVGTITPTWSGTLNSVYFDALTASGTTAFRIDDTLVRKLDSTPSVIPVPGTWRREVVQAVVPVVPDPIPVGSGPGLQ